MGMRWSRQSGTFTGKPALRAGPRLTPSGGADFLGADGKRSADGGVVKIGGTAHP